MKKILIFPYHPDIELLISHKKEWKDIVISGICSFREDHAIVHRLNQILGTSGEYRQLLRECDAVLLLDNFRDYKTEKYRQVIRDALAENKEVILVPRMAEELKADVSDRRISLLQHEYQKDRSRQILEGNIRYQRHTVETPVIAVAGMGKNCGKFECQIRMYKELCRQGYRTFWLTSNPLGIYFGGYTLPAYFFSNTTSFEECIIQLNYHLYDIAREEKPDVFLIGIPEGVAEFEAGETNHFGEYPLTVGTAVPVDAAVLCTYYMRTVRRRGAEELREYVRIRYHLPVCALAVSDTAYEVVEGVNQVFYSFLEKDYAKKHFAETEENEVPVMPLWDEKKTEKGLREVIARLEANIDAL